MVNLFSKSSPSTKLAFFRRLEEDQQEAADRGTVAAEPDPIEAFDLVEVRGCRVAEAQRMAEQELARPAVDRLELVVQEVFGCPGWGRRKVAAGVEPLEPSGLAFGQQPAGWQIEFAELLGRLRF